MAKLYLTYKTSSAVRYGASSSEVPNEIDCAKTFTDEWSRLVERWDGFAVVARYEPSTSSWMFIAIHDLSLGSAVGGCRMRTYSSPADGLIDAMRLAEGMTHKWAMLGFGFGGGKAVLAVPEPMEGDRRKNLFLQLGTLIEELAGLYSTGEDLGTCPLDIATLAKVTRFVHGIDPTSGEAIDSGPYTALGVFSGIRTSLNRVYSTPVMKNRTILVQGVGNVGAPLARMLVDAGAKLLICDTNETRLHSTATELNCETIPSTAVFDADCEVYVPCSIGGTLTFESARRLNCQIVSGAANNQLESNGVADFLHEREILFAPDFIVNAGGAIALPMLQNGASQIAVHQRINGISQTLDEVFDEALALNESPFHACHRRVARALASKQSQHPTALQNAMHLLFGHPSKGLW